MVEDDSGGDIPTLKPASRMLIFNFPRGREVSDPLCLVVLVAERFGRRARDSDRPPPPNPTPDSWIVVLS